MRRIAALSTAVLVVAMFATAASASAPKPPAGSYTFGAKYGSFKVNKKRDHVTNFKFIIVVGDDTTSQCSPAELPVGTITVKVTKAMKITAAHRGGYTAYIVGKSTPKTSSGITQIPETFKLPSGATVDGTMSLVFTYDNVKSGNVELTIGGCYVTGSFHKK